MTKGRDEMTTHHIPLPEPPANFVDRWAKSDVRPEDVLPPSAPKRAIQEPDLPALKKLREAYLTLEQLKAQLDDAMREAAGADAVLGPLSELTAELPGFTWLLQAAGNAAKGKRRLASDQRQHAAKHRDWHESAPDVDETTEGWASLIDNVDYEHRPPGINEHLTIQQAPKEALDFASRDRVWQTRELRPGFLATLNADGTVTRKANLSHHRIYERVEAPGQRDQHQDALGDAPISRNEDQLEEWEAQSVNPGWDPHPPTFQPEAQARRQAERVHRKVMGELKHEVKVEGIRRHADVDDLTIHERIERFRTTPRRQPTGPVINIITTQRADSHDVRITAYYEAKLRHQLAARVDQTPPRTAKAQAAIAISNLLPASVRHP